MRPQDRTAIAICAAIVVACAVHWIAPPAPVYHPIDHAWNWDLTASAAPMRWYGRSAWTLVLGVLTFAFAHALTGRIKRDPPPWLPALLTMLCATSFILALGLIAWNDWSVWMTR